MALLFGKEAHCVDKNVVHMHPTCQASADNAATAKWSNLFKASVIGRIEFSSETREIT